MRISFTEWTKSGSPWVWLNAGAVAISIIMVVGLLGLIAVRGLSHFWPADVMQATYVDKDKSYTLVGELVERETVPAPQLRGAGIEVPEGIESLPRDLLKVGNRDFFSADFVWAMDHFITEVTHPPMLFVAERLEWGNFYGYLREVRESGKTLARHEGYDKDQAYLTLWNEFQQRIDRVLEIRDQILEIEKHEIGAINYEMERLRLKERALELKQSTDQQAYGRDQTASRRTGPGVSGAATAPDRSVHSDQP